MPRQASRLFLPVLMASVALVACGGDSEPAPGIFAGSPNPPVSQTLPATPAPPTPTPAPTTVEYTVVAGDTLSEIAESFGVSVAEIVAANGDLDDPDLLVVGQVLLIPQP